jgi:hypothetical protein
MAFAIALLVLSGCANSNLTEVEKKPYFGQNAHFGMGNSYVPKEVRRVEPWWAIF